MSKDPERARHSAQRLLPQRALDDIAMNINASRFASVYKTAECAIWDERYGLYIESDEHFRTRILKELYAKKVGSL